MLVADLMTSEVVTAEPTMTLMEADELFTRHAISGAPVLDNGELVGVISQSDVVRVLYDHQIADRLVTIAVGDAMTGVPVTVGPDDPAATVARLMCDERVHRVLVTDESGLIGVVSALDLARLLI